MEADSMPVRLSSGASTLNSPLTLPLKLNPRANGIFQFLR
jgi:hypothetical protein